MLVPVCLPWHPQGPVLLPPPLGPGTPAGSLHRAQLFWRCGPRTLVIITHSPGKPELRGKSGQGWGVARAGEGPCPHSHAGLLETHFIKIPCPQPCWGQRLDSWDYELTPRGARGLLHLLLWTQEGLPQSLWEDGLLINPGVDLKSIHAPWH